MGVQGFDYEELVPTSDILFFDGIGEASNYVVEGPVLVEDNLFFTKLRAKRLIQTHWSKSK